MKIREILSTACKMINEDVLAEKLNIQGKFDENEEKLVKKLLKSFNFIQNEVATEFLPLRNREKIESKNGEFDLRNLEKEISHIISLKDKNGKNVSYKIFGGKMIFEGEANIDYCYNPQDSDLEDEALVFLPKRVFAYGVLREHYLIEDMPTEASQFEVKFKNSLLNFANKKTEIVMPKRTWR